MRTKTRCVAEICRFSGLNLMVVIIGPRVSDRRTRRDAVGPAQRFRRCATMPVTRIANIQAKPSMRTTRSSPRLGSHTNRSDTTRRRRARRDTAVPAARRLRAPPGRPSSSRRCVRWLATVPRQRCRGRAAGAEAGGTCKRSLNTVVKGRRMNAPTQGRADRIDLALT